MRMAVTFMSEIYCEDELPVKVALLSIIFMGLLLHITDGVAKSGLALMRDKPAVIDRWF